MKVLQVALALLVLPSSTEAHRRGGPRTKATEEQHRVQGPRGKAAKESRTEATEEQHRAKMFVPEAAKKKQAERAAVKMFVPEFAKKKQAERAEAHRRGGPRTKATKEQHRVQGPRGKAAKESRTKATEEQHRGKMFVPEAAKKKQAERAAVKMFVPEFAKKKQAERAAVSAHQTKVKSAPQCVTDKDWYDIDGEEYDCDWYAEYPQWRCIKFGSCFENFGKTANQACCVCDEWIGKAIDEDTEIPDDYEYEYMPNILTDGDYYYDACAPDNDLEEDKCVAEYGIVTDEDWYDIDGEQYDCDWYAEFAHWRCGKFGSCFENFGKTANQACCFCAEWIGKAIDEDTQIPDDYEYEYMPNGFTDGDYYYDACAPEDDLEEDKCASEYGIVTDKDWYDIDGEEYDCDWYAEFAHWRCGKFGSCFENFGKTANQACCFCAEWIGKGIGNETEIPDDYEYEYMPNALFDDADYYYNPCGLTAEK